MTFYFFIEENILKASWAPPRGGYRSYS